MQYFSICLKSFTYFISFVLLFVIFIFILDFYPRHVINRNHVFVSQSLDDLCHYPMKIWNVQCSAVNVEWSGLTDSSSPLIVRKCQENSITNISIQIPGKRNGQESKDNHENVPDFVIYDPTPPNKQEITTGQNIDWTLYFTFEDGMTWDAMLDGVLYQRTSWTIIWNYLKRITLHYTVIIKHTVSILYIIKTTH